MTSDRLLRVGVIGSIVAAVCCFTPLLVILLGLTGLFVSYGWLDFVLFPALALFLGMTVYALRKRRSP